MISRELLPRIFSQFNQISVDDRVQSTAHTHKPKETDAERDTYIYKEKESLREYVCDAICMANMHITLYTMYSTLCGKVIIIR